MFGSRVRFCLKTAMTLVRRRSWPGGTGTVTVRELSEESDLSAPYLAKIVQEMAAAGIVTARKGPGGGISLARPPQEISLADVIFALDRLDGRRRCVLEDKPCDEVEACAVHETFRHIREEILGRTTLADAAKEHAAKEGAARSDMDSQSGGV